MFFINVNFNINVGKIFNSVIDGFKVRFVVCLFIKVGFFFDFISDGVVIDILLLVVGKIYDGN